MDRNMRSSYANNGPRSLPHMGKRHSGNGHSGNGHSGNGHSGNGHGGNGHSGNGHGGNGHSGNGHGGNGHSGNGHGGNGHSGNGHSARLSPPVQQPSHNNGQQEDLINYIYDSWSKVSRELERGSDDAKYYQEVVPPRQLANFRPFNLEEWWARRLLQNINRKHRS